MKCTNVTSMSFMARVPVNLQVEINEGRHQFLWLKKKQRKQNKDVSIKPNQI